ncbi:MAG: single-stranded DNA-binding protein [Erysipelotrichaceae bacterium]|nr:single-stranded DNA-binding protein [Erysipelotrichaceae bacterium]
MLNFVTMIGTIEKMPEWTVYSEFDSRMLLILKVERPFRESNGEYANDYFTVELWRGIAEQTRDVCRLHDVIAVKGRMITREYPDADGITRSHVELMAEHVVFLSRRILSQSAKD